MRRVAPAACLCLLVGLLCLPLALAGCGESGAQGASTSAPALRRLALERADLATVAHGLLAAEPSIQREVLAARAAWPGIVQGLPLVVSAQSRALMFAGMRRSEEFATPRFISIAGQLTGESAATAGLLLSYEQLSQQGWRMTLAAAGHLNGHSALPAGTLAFLRTNAALYIGCLYDAHYNLSVIGKKMSAAYAKLGGPMGFGAALPASLMAQIAAFYSPYVARLGPKPPATAAGS